MNPKSLIATAVVAASLGGAAAVAVSSGATKGTHIQAMCFVFQEPRPDGQVPVLAIVEASKGDERATQVSEALLPGTEANAKAQAMAADIGVAVWKSQRP